MLKGEIKGTIERKENLNRVMAVKIRKERQLYQIFESRISNKFDNILPVVEKERKNKKNS